MGEVVAPKGKKDDQGKNTQRFDITSLLGIVSGFFLVSYAIVRGGGIEVFLDLNSFMITVGGTMAAIYISFPARRVHNVFFVFINIFRQQVRMPSEIVDTVAQLALTARKGGTLKLEKEEKKIGDTFLKRCVELVVDGVDPDMMETMLFKEIHAMKQRHQEGQHIFLTLANFAPAFGLIGTLIGLIQMLVQLDNPNAIGPGMSVALITTFYGAIMANMIFLPITEKLKARMNEEIFIMQLTAEGIIDIRRKLHPRDIEMKLQAYLPSSMRHSTLMGSAGV